MTLKNNKVFIIAEIGVNHNGKLSIAKKLIIAAKKCGADAVVIRKEIASRFDYDLSRSVDEIGQIYEFDVSCAGTVPQAITCALEGSDYEDVVRNAVSIDGDTDTVACIAGGIAEMMFGLPEKIAETARGYLTDELVVVLDKFTGQVRS